MEHFYQNLPGWCDFADLYAERVAALPDGAHIVELGVWAGQSTACMAVEIANSGKVIRFDVVDHFQGSPESDMRMDNQREVFEKNIAPVRHLVRNIHQMKTWAAAGHYLDESLDFVFVDAGHTTETVLKDLDAWWPKIKPGGMLAGHDADWASVQKALKPWSELNGVDVSLCSRRSWQVVKPVRLTDDALNVPAGARKCLVAVCSNERTIYRKTVQSLLALGWGQRVLDATQSHGFTDIQFAWVSRFVLVSDLRNEAARIALAQGCSHVLFLDADMEWPEDVLTRMLAHHDRGIVSGLYFLKSWPHHPVALQSPKINPQTLQVDYTYAARAPLAEGLVPVDLVGMGCTLVPTAVFTAIGDPWFVYQQDMNGRWTVTEDVAFCQKAKAIGCPILLDPDVKCRHIGQESVGEAHYDRAAFEMQMLERTQPKVGPSLVAVPA